jgi:raffinose/stachyose/melibiose transport system permease protein
MADSVNVAPKKSSPVRPAPGAFGGGSSRRRHNLTPSGFLWILPGFVVSVGLIYFCIGYSGYISLLPWNWSPGDPETIQGFASYNRALKSALFWTSLEHTLLFFVATFAIQCTMGVIFAAILHSRVYAGTLFKVIIFLPVVIAPAIMAPVHRRVFAVDGPINWILQHVGLIQVDRLGNRDWTGWLSSALTHVGMGNVTPNWIQPSTSVWVIIGVQIWSSIGMAFILFYAAMGQIDPEILEAARIDGAGNIRMLVSVVVPNMKATIISLAVLNAITALKLFDFPYLITGGGPAHSSEFLGTYIYSELFGVSTHYGFAATLSILLLILALAFSIIISLTTREGKPGRKAKGVRV